jgi:predicted amidohydrolase YtcJ
VSPVLFLLATTWFAAGANKVQSYPDLIVTGAKVVTQASGTAEAFAITDGKFTAVGSSRAIRALAGARTRTVDLHGATVVPGFIDAHLHPFSILPEALPAAEVNVGPEACPTMDALIARLKWKAARTPKGQWIRGYRYQETKLGRTPTAADLDQASTDHPIMITHSSGHVSVVNSYVLEHAGITGETPVPVGGVIGKDATGHLNGFLGESAKSLAYRNLPRPIQATPEEKVRGYQECFYRFAAKGITSAGVAGTDFPELQIWEQMRDKGLLITRLNVMILANHWKELLDRKATGNMGDDWIRLGSVKLFHGNSLSGHTCWVTEPYVDRPNYFGVPPARSQAELDQVVANLHNAGFQICTHSNGDREIDMVVSAYEKAERANPRPDTRHRIEHCSIVTPDLLQRIKAANIVIVPHSYEWEHGDQLEAFGSKRWDMMCPNKSGLDYGIPIAGHSDFGVSAADPLLRMQCMVTRKSKEGKIYGAKQRVTRAQALRAWTLGSAYAAFEETKKGSIQVGKLADFVVLGANPLTTKPDSIKDISILKTYVGGKVVYQLKPGEKLEPVFSMVEDDD